MGERLIKLIIRIAMNTSIEKAKFNLICLLTFSGPFCLVSKVPFRHDDKLSRVRSFISRKTDCENFWKKPHAINCSLRKFDPYKKLFFRKKKVEGLGNSMEFQMGGLFVNGLNGKFCNG
jgi:hypothetical protein